MAQLVDDAQRAAFRADLADDAFRLKISENPELLEAWKALGEFPNLRKIPGNLEVLDKVKGKFTYGGKTGQEALEEIFTGHKSAQKFIDNFKKYDEIIGEVDDITVTGIKSSSEVRILNKSKQVGKVVDGKLNVGYSGFGGDIVCDPNKTTTLLGKWKDPDGGGTKDILDSKLFKVGENKGGANVLSFDGSGMSEAQQWAVNYKWLNEAAQRGDVIRVVSNPMNLDNLFKSLDRVPVDQLKTPKDLADYLSTVTDSRVLENMSFYGKEVQLLSKNNYLFDNSLNQFVK